MATTDIDDANDTNSLHNVKLEPSVASLEAVPGYSPENARLRTGQLDSVDFPEEYPTPKKIADLRLGSLSRRASSSERSSPAPTAKGASSSGRPGSTKKGTAIKKPAAKKRRLNDQDNENGDTRRSNTPVSSRASKTPAPKKQESVSISGSPAPESKKKTAKKTKAATILSAENGYEKDEDEQDCSDPDEVFCICRKPDNHTWMIGCDGGCEDWFHGKCVNIDPRDADLIDKYICPNCQEEGKGHTSWKAMCRLHGCRKPARVSARIPSKYCSDEHGREFMMLKTSHLNIIPAPPKTRQDIQPVTGHTRSRLRDDHSVEGDDSHVEDGMVSNDEDEGDSKISEELSSRGGVLTAGELKAIVMGVSSAEEFRRLGDRLISLPPDEVSDGEEEQFGPKQEEGSRRGKRLGLDIDVKSLTYCADEAAKIEKLRKTRDDLLHRREMLSARTTFLALVRQRAKSIVERLKQTDPKGGWKDICGFDSRLAWSDEEFDDWRLSPAGRNALEDGTPEALAASYAESKDSDGDVTMTTDDGDLAFLTCGVCMKKRCERHKQWAKIHQQEISFEENMALQDLANCKDEAQAVVERAVLRMWAERDGPQGG